MKYKLKVYSLIIADILLINISMLLVFLLKYEGRYAHIPEEIIGHAALIALTATAVKVACFCFFRFYSSVWKYAGIFEAALIVGAILAGNGITWGCLSFGDIRINPGTSAINILTDMFLIGGVRFAYRAYSFAGVHPVFGKFKKRVLIIGNNDAGAAVVKGIQMHPELKVLPVAMADDDIAKQGRKINGVPILGQIKDIPAIAQKKKIDEVIVVVPSTSGQSLSEIFNTCSDIGCRVKVLPSYSQLMDESAMLQKVRDVNLEDLLGREPVTLDIEGISSCFKDKCVLVTGGGGSIGSELCRQIAPYGPGSLIILDNYENGAYEIQVELQQRYPRLKLLTVIANIREKDRMDSVFEKYRPDLVFHAAAHKHVPLMEENPGEAVKNNILGTLNVAVCSSEADVQKFVLISTDKAVNPTSIMGATKRIAEMIVQSMDRQSNSEFVAVRFGNVLGSSGSVIPLFQKQIEAGGPVTVTHPEVTRFFMTIPEAVQLVLEASAIAKGGEIFVLDMGKPVRIYELAKNLITLSGFRPGKDIEINITGLRPGEKLYEEIMLAEEGVQATKFNKIYIAQPADMDLKVLKSKIDVLMHSDLDNIDEVAAQLKLLVPNFKRIEM